MKNETPHVVMARYGIRPCRAEITTESLARFRHKGDAFAYARNLAGRLDSGDWHDDVPEALVIKSGRSTQIVWVKPTETPGTRKFRVSCSWSMAADITVRAKDKDEAIDLASHMVLPEGEYMKRSWEILDVEDIECSRRRPAEAGPESSGTGVAS